MWENIKQGKMFRLNSFENILYRLCWAYLFGEIGDGNKVLSEQRAKAFATKEFNELIVGIPFIAVLIFSMLDFSFREEACDEYKDAIKHYSDKKRIVLTEKDFIYEYQNTQDRVRFEAYKEVCEKNMIIRLYGRIMRRKNYIHIL